MILAVSCIGYVMIGYRFGHQSDQDESSGQNSADNLNVPSSRDYLVVSEIFRNIRYHQQNKVYMYMYIYTHIYIYVYMYK